MTCDDVDDFVWPLVPVGSTYELTVTGPAEGFAKAKPADQDGSTTPPATWRDFFNKTHIEKPPSGRNFYVMIVPARLKNDPPVQIKAVVKTPAGDVHVREYCRTMKTDTDMVVHRLEMI